MNLFRRIAICIVAMLCLASMLFVFTACDKEEPEPVYELKLYDVNWDELEKDKSGDYLVIYEYKYDGKQKGFNAICFMDGKEFYRFEYLEPKWSYRNPISICSNEGVYFPVEKGRYHFYYSFDDSLQNPGLIYDTPIGQIRKSELPKVEYQIIIDII